MLNLRTHLETLFSENKENCDVFLWQDTLGRAVTPISDKSIYLSQSSRTPRRNSSQNCEFHTCFPTWLEHLFTKGIGAEHPHTAAQQSGGEEAAVGLNAAA